MPDLPHIHIPGQFNLQIHRFHVFSQNDAICRVLGGVIHVAGGVNITLMHRADRNDFGPQMKDRSVMEQGELG